MSSLADLRAARAVAVVRLSSADALVAVAEALVSGGLRALELTLTTPGALGALASVKAAVGPGVLVGMGSVLTTEQAKAAADAGADFLVSPIHRRALVDAAHAAGRPILTGAYTPTEAFTAHADGADAVKLFPADTLGPAYVRALLAPMPHLPLVPTGGVTPDNAGGWLRAGAMAVGLGSSLVPPALVDARDWAGLRRLAEATMRSVQD